MLEGILEAFVVIGFCAVVLAWFATVFISHLLLYAFVDRFPQEAAAKIPHARSRVAHPKKFFYFLSRDFRSYSAQCPYLEQLRRSLIRLLCLSLVLLPAFFIATGVFALFSSRELAPHYARPRDTAA